jgi:hypothetical protein
MTSLAEPPSPVSRSPSRGAAPRAVAPHVHSPAERLRHAFAAVRVSFTWLGVRKALNAEQKAQAAEGFGAEGTYLSAAKKLLDTRDPAFRAVTAVRGQVLGYWRGTSLPYPEPGLRLIRQDAVQPFDEQMVAFRTELHATVHTLDERLDVLKADARERLGSLFDPADYPVSLDGLFAVDWDFPSVEPPEYLLRLNPHLFEQERRRVAERFDEAVRLAEEAFAGEFAKLTSHLVERLTAGPAGERKVFRDSAVDNLRAFFERFRNLNVRSSPELDRLVETARAALDGVEPGAVRDSAGLRQQIKSQLVSVRSALDDMLVDQPRRRILRQRSGAAGAEGG